MDTLDTSLGPRPSLGRAATQFGRPPRVGAGQEQFGRTRRNSQPETDLPTRKLTLKEIIDQGPDLSPWHKNSPYRLEKKSFIAECKKREKEREEGKERRRSARQFDGSRSSTPSPRISRSNSLSVSSFGHQESLVRPGKGSSIHSTQSGQSNQSSRSSKRTNLSRVLTVDSNDRISQGLEARQERQLRESGAGADGESDSAPHGRQGQRRLFGKYKGKGTRYVIR